MSNKSGTSSQVITLPRGGGALQGLGETFAPDLFTGTGNFNVPLALPSGRNGFQPELSLVYSTGHPNGPFGLGWDLSFQASAEKLLRAFLGTVMMGWILADRTRLFSPAWTI